MCLFVVYGVEEKKDSSDSKHCVFSDEEGAWDVEMTASGAYKGAFQATEGSSDTETGVSVAKEVG